MASKVVVHPESIADLLEAISYYDEISSELSEDLIEHYRSCIKQLTSNPRIYPSFYTKYRKINLERFPYKIVFRIQVDTIHIVAFAHHKRKPSYWRSRK